MTLHAIIVHHGGSFKKWACIEGDIWEERGTNRARVDAKSHLMAKLPGKLWFRSLTRNNSNRSYIWTPAIYLEVRF